MRNKILLMVLLSLTGVVLSIVGLLSYLQHQTTLRSFSEQQTSLVKFAVDNFRDGIATGRLTAVEGMLNHLQGSSIFEGAILFDAEMVPLITRPEGFEVTPSAIADVTTGRKGRGGHISYETGVLHGDDGDVLGHVVIAFTLDPIREEARQSLELAMGLGLLTLVPIMGIVAWQTNRMVTPLAAVTSAIHQIRAGNVDQQIDYSSKDEVGTLAQAFRELVGQIKETTHAAERLSNGDPTVHVLVRSEKDMLSLAFNRMAENLTQQRQYLEEQVSARTAELTTAHKESELLMDSISSILINVDSNGRIRRWNKKAEGTFGRMASKVDGHPLHDIGIDWEWPKLEQALLDCRDARVPVRLDNLRFSNLSGDKRFASFTLNPVIDAAEQQPGVLILGADVTERKQLETRLRLAQKMESIGQLTAGVAHEINTPIQYVGDNLHFLEEGFTSIRGVLDSYATLLRRAEAGVVAPELLRTVGSTIAEADLEYVVDEIPTAIKQSLEGIERVASLVRAMKDFSHPGTAEKQMIDLNKMIASAVTVAKNEWKYTSEVVTELDQKLPLVLCLPGELNQVLLNLIVNAAHANGDVVGKENGEKGNITVRSGVTDEWVEVDVQDTGTGISEDVQHNVFDLFFTTKEMGKGTGQGLAIAHDIIVNKHGGMLTFETEIGKGTTFVIRLPIQTVASVTAVASSIREEEARRTG